MVRCGILTSTNICSSLIDLLLLECVCILRGSTDVLIDKLHATIRPYIPGICGINLFLWLVKNSPLGGKASGPSSSVPVIIYLPLLISTCHGRCFTTNRNLSLFASPYSHKKAPQLSQNSRCTPFSCMKSFGLFPFVYLNISIGVFAVSPKAPPNATLQERQ